MNHQVSHESEWLRQLRQKEQELRREIFGAETAAGLTTRVTETRFAPRPARTGSGMLAGLVHRFARICAASLRRSAGVTPRS